MLQCSSRAWFAWVQGKGNAAGGTSAIALVDCVSIMSLALSLFGILILNIKDQVSTSNCQFKMIALAARWLFSTLV
jgi:hypothetical protein